ncbi:MAG: serine/threonine protein kinase [Planctomycetes bacterium]|nr:serine/threonine protein kinase [Planctomycetota bacterium]
MTEQKPSDETKISLDTELGRMVVEQNLATQDEVSHCLNLKAQAAQGEGEAPENISKKPLDQILIDEGVVTASQMARIKATLDDARRRHIPGYKILSRLGAGAMAVVFKATQLSLDRTVAIKVLNKKLSENAEYVKRFYQEGKAAAKLNHPNIVQAIDVGEAGGLHYFVMEYVRGHELYEELAEGKVFEEARALKIIIQIARALEHAHQQGLIHRDVKPRNIMLTSDGTAKLADMGLARQAQDAQVAEAEAGRAYGTPYYISPEQIRGQIDIDFRADIYSLGATLYHMVTGRVPFEAPTPAAVMHKHLKEPLVPPDHINTELSAGLGEVVEVMMAKSRDGRYASTSDLLVDLEAIAEGKPPPLAHMQIDEDLLSGLASGDTQAVDDAEVQQHGDVDYTNLVIIIIALIAGLTISVIVNVLQLLN